MNTFMLVISIFASDGRQDIALAFDLSFHDCDEIATIVEQGTNNNAQVFCELEGSY
tara:strand:+ start:363 stop:530 length:168 start_codon:yes stop_codon:yes gene_type:complete